MAFLVRLERNAPRQSYPTDATDLEQLSGLRGISVDTLDMAQIHVTDDGWWGIPYPHLTGTWYVRSRNPDPEGQPKYLSPKNAEPHLYNPLGLGPNVDEVWLCEGEFDTLALIDAGVPAVGYPGVSTISEHVTDSGPDDHVRFKAAWRLLFLDAYVVAAGDMDKAGKKAIRAIIRAFAPRAGHFQVSDDWDDINDWWRGDPDSMSAAINDFRKGEDLG